MKTQFEVTWTSSLRGWLLWMQNFKTIFFNKIPVVLPINQEIISLTVEIRKTYKLPHELHNMSTTVIAYPQKNSLMQ